MTAYLSSDPAATFTRLRCSNADIERGRLIHQHRSRRPDSAHERELRRWLAAVGGAADDLVGIAQVDDPDRGAALALAVGRVRASGAPLSLGDLAVTGRDLQDIGIPAGPGMGVVLRRLLDQVLDDPSRNSKPRLLEIAKKAAEQG
jgi:hypothetical protein